jgi:DNA N-6-adenine-methyltransferase (Dam)
MSGNEWYTPSEFIELARKVMGSIDLDPASCEKAQKTVKAGAYFTKETDGLAQPWFGRVFLNPPYSKHLITQFIDKLVAELPAIEQGIVLTDARTDTRWFRKLMAVSTVCLTYGRIHFINANGEAGEPTIGSVFFYHGNNQKRFAKVFSEIGAVIDAREKPVSLVKPKNVMRQVRRPAHRPVKYSPYQMKKALELSAEGASLREIADHIAVPYQTVWRMLKSE